MRKNKKKIIPVTLSGSTLVETIVASLIFMLIFVISMSLLTQFMIFDKGEVNYLMIENDMNQCQRSICKNKINIGDVAYKYNWGKIDVEISIYKNDIYMIKMIATTNKSHQQFHYRFLKANEIN